MKYRKLGHGLEVSAIGIGCMPMIKGGNILYGEAADLDYLSALAATVCWASTSSG